jgi:hypothetical protein
MLTEDDPVLHEMGPYRNVVAMRRGPESLLGLGAEAPK